MTSAYSSSLTRDQWDLLPDDFPSYSTVYYYFRQWKTDGTWKRVHNHIVEWVRVVNTARRHPVRERSTPRVCRVR